MKKVIAFLLPFAVATGLPCIAHADCPDQGLIEASATAFLSKSPGLSYPEGTTLDQAYCAQGKYLDLLEAELGPRAGYKAGQTSKAIQARFGASEPVGGVLFESQLLPSGTEIEAKYGVLGAYEMDMVVTVTDEKINEATSHEEVIKHLGEVRPMIELLDIPLAQGQPMTLATVVSYNVMARYGVVGKGIPVDPTQEFIESLASFEVIMTDESGTEIERSTGAVVMENPLNVVLWLVNHVKSQGEVIKKGDVLSLGTMGTPRLAEAGKTVTVKYVGLPTGVSETVVKFK